MTKSRRLQSLADLAKSDEQQAATVLGECQRRLREQTQRLEELTAYRQEYIDQLQRLSRSGMGAEIMHRYRGFVAKLDTAIDLQRKRVDGLREEYKEKDRAWSTARVKHKSLDKVVTRHRAVECRQEERREQDQCEEAVQGRFFLEEDG